MTDILGLSAFYHESAACLLRGGEITAAAQEERFTSKKPYAGFPSESIHYCLREGRVALGDLRDIAFYEYVRLRSHTSAGWLKRNAIGAERRAYLLARALRDRLGQMR